MDQHANRNERAGFLLRARRRFWTEATKALFRETLTIKTALPLVSFTFDDFPRSAFLEGGSILARHGAAGTYYVSMSLMGKESHLGPMFQAGDLTELARTGHEIGSHTFGHCHSWNTPPDLYEQSILDNEQAFNEVVPGASFRTFAYPHSAPQPGVKRVASTHFLCCRGGGLKPGHYFRRHAAGGQTFNGGTTDLNYLCAFFLEKSRDNPDAVRRVIAENARARGWLVFATHDVSAEPSPYGCTPEYFEQVVEWSVESGARILPVVQALQVLRSGQAEEPLNHADALNASARVRPQ